MRMRMRGAAGLVALGVACLLAGRAAASPMMPLEVGDHWEYRGIAGSVQAVTLTGTRVLSGRTVVVKSFAFGDDAGLENWWLDGPNGELLLAGFSRPGFTLGYEPPITMCGAAPTLGQTWSTHVVAWDLATSTVYAEFDITLGVLEDVVLEVPRGVFACAGIGQVPGARPASPLAAKGLALDGRSLGPGASTQAAAATDWYSLGIGEVQYLGTDLYQLTELGLPVGARRATWGALKQSYR